MCCRVFVFYDLKNGNHVYLNGPDHADPDKLLWLYINWYNHDFIDELGNDVSPISFCDFKYLEYYCPINFYDDYKNEYDNSLTFQMIREACNDKSI